ncbi:ISL3-like element IS469 family transposase [Paractinoplanes ferrugineus]|uniref:ISL3 family transposase n=1 Tax=Paractinoplanes ferrugineus TaxID=113564 RepID=A0A919MHQ4_9ACTN|nr:ISL3 family transposase [Actinoplanes ferrugineus]
MATKIQLHVRRFICGNAACAVRTFVEQVDGVTRRRVRSTDGLRRTLTAIGLALAGRAGARLGAVLGMVTSRSSLLRLVRALPDPPERPVTVLGVDDFAIKKGQNYGTVLIDCEDGRVIDLLPGRDAAPLAGWLDAHSKPEVICRDRASAYAEGARTGAPDAVQVADRFHLWQNLAKAVERCVARYKNCLQESVVAPVDKQPDAAGGPEPSSAMAQRRREHHRLVHDLLGPGAGIRQIARHLGWSHNTVSRYARAATWQEMVVGQKARPSSLDPFKPHLLRRIAEGCLKAATLHREITAQGFTGKYGIVRAFVEQHRTRPDLGKMAKPPSVREVTGWICRHPDHLVERDTDRLEAFLGRCPELAAAADLVRSFAHMLTGLHGDRLGEWIAAAQQAGLPGITSFANGLISDLDAVTAGLTMPHSSGPVEGNVNRIKMLKRQMYGRAGFDLLRKRVLLAS